MKMSLGAINNNPETYNFEYGTIRLKNPTKEGKTFNGWEMNDELIESFSSSLKKNITIVATWIDEVVLTYTKDSDDNITLTGFENEDLISTLRILEIGETYDEYNVVGIEQGAFSGCMALESITLPFVGGTLSATEASSTTLFGYIFGTEEYPNSIIEYQLYSIGGSDYSINYLPVTLKSVIINGGNILFGAFSGCEKLESIKIPDKVINIEDYVFQCCTNLKNMTIPNGVKRIGYYTFSGCTSLTNIAIPNSVEDIGYGAFSGCLSLETITIPNSVKIVEASAFSKCTSLESVTIGNSVETIYGSAFSSCSNLESIIIPDNVKKIGKRVFEYCDSLKSITIGSGVESIGAELIMYCDAFNSVYIKSSKIADGIISAKSAGGLVNNSATIYILDSITTIGSYITDNYTKVLQQ